ncbi:FxSxx-COOH system tetratricopeptide repeat protein [Streptomyces sp. B93]|uniref:FxSxx-COOH system tetratricopeptide repeat protein n=1 Tax=Streptomyces sp. B93 TaxID=2824875 RepID=UPI0027E57990|nr:FxSxx-COOH system tetratricopeptide repeat protein [Streptomyces sp. B93]
MTEHHPASEGGAAHGPAPDERRLRVGDLHWREVADALWLVREHPGLVAPDPADLAVAAPQVPEAPRPERRDAPEGRGTETGTPDDAPEPGSPTPTGTSPTSPQEPESPEGPEAPEALPAEPPSPRPEETSGTREPRTPLRRPRRRTRGRKGGRTPKTPFARALRPLRQRDRTSPFGELDEERTGEQLAEAPWLPPVLRPGHEPRWSVVVVVDTAPHMVAWRGTTSSLAGDLRLYGGFRSVETRLLDTAAGTPDGVVLRTPGQRGRPGRPQPVRSLVDLSGRRIVLVVTDGMAPAWHTGAVRGALAVWGRHQPLAILTPLPQRLWDRTGLLPERVRMHAAGRGAAGGELTWELLSPRGASEWSAPLRPRRSFPVPVLETAGEWLAPWARFVAGTEPRWAEAAATLVAPGAKPIPPLENAPLQESAAQKVARFRVWASPESFELAVRLAAVELDLTVMLAVQRDMLPASGPVQLAEVLVSGLIEPRPGRPESYAFLPGIRSELLASSTKRATLRASRRAAEVLAPKSSAARDLLDYFAGREITGRTEITPDNVRFRTTEYVVLSSLAGPHLRRAHRIRGLLSAHIHSDELTGAGVHTEDITDHLRKDSGTMNTADAPESRSTSEPLPSVSAIHGQIDSTTRQGGTTVTTVAPGTATPAPEPEGVTLGKPQEGVSSLRPAVLNNMPPRNALFTGRDDLLRMLERNLGQGPTAVLPHALHGMGGVGKSQLALEYVYRNAARYDVVWWIPAERPTQIAQALVELAQRLGLRVTSEANTAVPAVLESLRTGKPYGNWLLVFDNAESPEAVRNYFPTSPGSGPVGSILVTSRNPQWNTLAHPLEVDVFKREESIHLLQRRNPDLPDSEADQLAAVLGDLPLAVEQASAWRAETGMPAGEYLRLFEEKRAELMTVSKPTHYEETVATAWNVSLDHLERKNAAALQLLQVCAYLAPEPISRSLFSRAPVEPIAPDLDRALTDPLRLGRAIREINRYSLAKIDHRTNSIQMHRLVQSVLAARMSQEQRDRMQHGAHLLLAGDTPGNPQDPINWAKFGELYPHVLVSDAVQSSSRHVRQTVHSVAEYLFHWGDHEGAREFAQNGYETWSRLYGEDDGQTLTLGRHLRYILWTMGRYEEAAAITQRMRSVLERPEADADEELLRVLGLGAADRRAAGDFKESLRINEEVYQRSLPYGDDEPETLLHAHNLAVSLRVNGKFREALALDQQTWQRRSEMYGEESLSAMLTESSIALDRRELGEYLPAVRLFEDITERYRQQIGENHPNTLRNLARLGVTLRKAGRHAEAAELTRRARKELINRYGPEHPDSLVASLNYSVDLRQLNDLKEAVQLGEQTRDLYVQVLGSGHPHTVEANMDLAVTYRLLNKVGAARALNEAALERCVEALGEEHPDTLACRINLASDMFAQGEVTAALTMDEETLEISARVLGEKHPTTLVLTSNLAQDLRALGRTDEAETHRRAALTGLPEVLGEEHPAYADAVAWQRANCDIDPMPI